VDGVGRGANERREEGQPGGLAAGRQWRGGCGSRCSQVLRQHHSKAGMLPRDLTPNWGDTAEEREAPFPCRSTEGVAAGRTREPARPWRAEISLRNAQMSCRLNGLCVTLQVDRLDRPRSSSQFDELESKAEVSMHVTVIPLNYLAHCYGVCRCGRGVAPVGR